MTGKKRLTVADFPKLAKEWHTVKNSGLKPEQITAGSGKKVWWRCSKDPDHEWLSTPSDRKHGRGCPFCDGKKVSRTNSLAVLFPDIANEWHPTRNGNLTPLDVTAFSGKKVWWQCPKNPGHEWETRVANRTKVKTGCSICAGQKVPLVDSLAMTHPHLAKEWHPTRNRSNRKPYMLSAKSKRKFWWLCPKKHEYKARIIDRTEQNEGCPVCSKEKSGKKQFTCSSQVIQKNRAGSGSDE